MHITDLVKESKEAAAVLSDFASRKRVHLNIPVHIPRLYLKLYRTQPSLNKDKFNRVFKTLEALGYGRVEVNTKGYAVFRPNIPILAIGKEAFKTPVAQDKPLEEIETPTGNVVVFFRVHGLRCKAEVPKDALDDFEELVNA